MININKKIENNWLLMKYLNLSLYEIDNMDIYHKGNLIKELKNNLKTK